MMANIQLPKKSYIDKRTSVVMNAADLQAAIGSGSVKSGTLVYVPDVVLDFTNFQVTGAVAAVLSDGSIEYYAKTDIMTQHIASDWAWFNSIWTNTTKRLDSLDARVDSLTTSVQNKTLDESQALDIEALSSQSGGWTVPAGLGGKITGTGGSYLLVGTGEVEVNGVVVFNNDGIPLSIGAPAMSEIVEPGDVITSSAMITLTYTPYVAA